MKKRKIVELELILEKEKKDTEIYPKKLKSIIRNNPLMQNITKDSWNNDFFYKLNSAGNNYILISKGKDGIINTEDDITK